MNFNVYLDDDSAERLARMARKTGTTRNALIRQAVRAWLDAQGAAWPAAVLEFTGDRQFEPFEAHRAELEPAREDPFASARSPQLARTRQRSKRRTG